MKCSENIGANNGAAEQLLGDDGGGDTAHVPASASGNFVRRGSSIEVRGGRITHHTKTCIMRRSTPGLMRDGMATGQRLPKRDATELKQKETDYGGQQYCEHILDEHISRKQSFVSKNG